jgi:hypothetical protein
MSISGLDAMHARTKIEGEGREKKANKKKGGVSTRRQKEG